MQVWIYLEANSTFALYAFFNKLTTADDLGVGSTK